MKPEIRTARRITIEFEDGDVQEWDNAHGKFRGSENQRLNQGRIEDAWDEFCLTWYIPISAIRHPVVDLEEEIQELTALPIKGEDFKDDPLFAGIQDNKVLWHKTAHKDGICDCIGKIKVLDEEIEFDDIEADI